MKYVFLGNQAIIGDRILNEFGQVIDLPEDIGNDAMLSAALIPQAEYDAIMKPLAGTLEASPGARRNSPAFQAAKTKALVKLHELRERLQNPPEPPAAKLADKTPAPPAFPKPAAAAPKPEPAELVEAQAKKPA